jgi:copper(I)-binding protein
MKRLILLAALGLTACSGEPKVASVQALDPWCRPSGAGAYTAACYVTLTPNSAERLMSVTSPLAQRVEIHATRIDDSGVASMTLRKEGLALPRDRAYAFKAGADHLMLIAPIRPLVEGETVPLTLTFEKAPPVTVRATVRMTVQ